LRERKVNRLLPQYCHDPGRFERTAEDGGRLQGPKLMTGRGLLPEVSRRHHCASSAKTHGVPLPPRDVVGSGATLPGGTHAPLCVEWSRPLGAIWMWGRKSPRACRRMSVQSIECYPDATLKNCRRTNIGPVSMSTSTHSRRQIGCPAQESDPRFCRDALLVQPLKKSRLQLLWSPQLQSPIPLNISPPG
jgi:hypothetical protein